MKTSDFYYDLPEELIAQEPLKDRSASRLLVLDKETGKIEHKIFKDITQYLYKGDCLVINDTKVMPARLIGARKNTGARVEILLLVRKDMDTWEVLTYPGKKAKPGDRIVFGDGRLEAEILEVIEGGNRIVKFHYEGVFENILDELGEMPIPPYITHKLEDKNRYQTVYAEHEGSAAAPTAGLHFTKELLEEIKDMGVEIVHVTLHVGLGTFRPVKVEDVTNHEMHSEYYIVEQAEADKINNARKNGGRIIAVGTTSTRTLESVADEDGIIHAQSGWTKIFIYPGYKFKAIDCLITNFHLPESTLIMLVAALVGKDTILNTYKIAVEEKYRFFSFGDCMFVGCHHKSKDQK
ncbi:MAG: tRNA preQ1(34) S-adenosylmethionine ribosyltransferase-isomerase QueA [Clostridiales bacterium]|nr:tRNA preQ1(34) S-adenosylmethionine ribosyltransferase-isomerase QueA [Clostridiales bacterium]